MGYVLQAVIAAEPVLREVAVGPDMPVCRLDHRLALMPITPEFHDRVSVADGDRLGFWMLPGSFAGTLALWSHSGPVAYVEAEYFGGTGQQRAAVWEAGALAFGPLHCAEGEGFPPEGSPISQALRRLGVSRGDHFDEFDSAGLSRHRTMERWINAAD